MIIKEEEDLPSNVVFCPHLWLGQGIWSEAITIESITCVYLHNQQVCSYHFTNFGVLSLLILRSKTINGNISRKFSAKGS